MAEGRFIAVEGLDGSGLTTQAELLRNWFLKKGLECYLTKEPTDGPAGAMIRLALAGRLTSGMSVGASKPSSDTVGAATLALLFAADRIDHLETDILPKLEMGIHVVCDRYYLSSFAYQGLGADLEWLRGINWKCRAPDLTVFLDVPVAICKKRMERQRWHVELYEDPDKLEQVSANYMSAIRELMFQRERIEVINGTDSMQAVHRAVVNAVRKILGKYRPPVDRQLSFETPSP